MKADQVARALGWFSIGLGLAELVAPKKMSRATGLNVGAAMMPLLGMREITSGIGILANRQPAEWVWSRVAGDIMDLAILGAGFKSKKSDATRLAIATAMVAGVTAADVLCGKQLCEEKERVRARNGDGASEAAGSDETFRTITINKSARELYEFWRNVENLQQIMPTLKSVKNTGEKTSHWVAKGPGGVEVEWDSEITEDNPADRISWRSLPGTKFPNSGTIRFEELPGDRGTVVRLKMICDAHAGIAAKLAKVFGKSPQQQTMEFLRRFKQFMETGEIATTQGQTAGRKTSLSPKFDVGARKMAEAF